MLEAMTRSAQMLSIEHSGTAAPIWILETGTTRRRALLMISCPEWLRTFPQSLNEDIRASRTD